jgi:ribosomal protein S18 acetylase RimI-like enzyme
VAAGPRLTIRRATPEDAPEVARLLHDFNSSYDEYTPGVAAITERAGPLIAARQMTALLAGEPGEPAVGIADVRFTPSVFTGKLDADLNELYVEPAHRGRGIGRALIDEAITVARAAGANWMGLVTGEEDTAAIGLYESSGFTNRSDPPDGPLYVFYERDL